MEVSSRISTSSSRRAWINRSATLRSRPRRINASMAVPRTITVTAEPSLRKILANSMAMIPAPTMTTLLGRKARWKMLSLSKMRTPSKGIPGSRTAVDPAQMRIFSVVSCTEPPSRLSTYTSTMLLSSSAVRRCIFSGGAGTSSALPCRYATLNFDSRATWLSALFRASRAHMFRTCFQMTSLSRPWACRAAMSSFLAASRSALENSPVGPPKEGSMPLLSGWIFGLSMMMARRPM
mmetsp:Transcript_22817/g.41087  ORF Transcript_22817/g.41087 Transcript_22817/m.41087 type:complete len:236 (-) Transcript_22817:213-920(-)